jgi:hypothetical protein
LVSRKLFGWALFLLLVSAFAAALLWAPKPGLPEEKPTVFVEPEKESGTGKQLALRGKESLALSDSWAPTSSVGPGRSFRLPVPESFDPRERMTLHLAAFVDLAEQDPRAAWEELRLWQEMDPSWARELWRAWLEAEETDWHLFLFPALTSWIHQLPPEERSMAVEFLLPEMAARDPGGTAGWIADIHLPADETFLMDLVWQVGWRAQPETMLGILQRAEPARQQELLKNFRDVVEFSLADWALQSSDDWPILRSELSLMLAEELSMREPQLAWHWVANRFQPHEDPALYWAVAENWARENPAAALQAADELPPGAASQEIRRRILEAWREQDALAVEQYLRTGEIPAVLDELPVVSLEPPADDQ